MEIEEIKVTKKEVEQELEDLEKALEKGYISKNNRLVRDLLLVYGHLKLGGKIIDVPEVFQKAGLDEFGDPRLAIVRADARNCYLYKYSNGAALFSKERKEEYNINMNKKLGDVKVPNGTFEWDADALKNGKRFRKTSCPLIPPRVSLAVSTRIMPEHYHILFETTGWVECKLKPPVSKDPILGKMLTEKLFGVLATWELTELEAKIVEGKL